MIYIELGDREKKSIDELRTSINYLSVLLRDKVNLNKLRLFKRENERVESYIQMLKSFQLVRQIGVDGVLGEMKAPENAISCIRFVDYIDDWVRYIEYNNPGGEHLVWWNSTLGAEYIQKLDMEWNSLLYSELATGFNLFIGGLRDTAQIIYNLFHDMEEKKLQVNSYTISFQKFLNTLWWWTKIWTNWAELDMSLKDVPELSNFYNWSSVNLPSQSS